MAAPRIPTGRQADGSAPWRTGGICAARNPRTGTAAPAGPDHRTRARRVCYTAGYLGRSFASTETGTYTRPGDPGRRTNSTAEPPPQVPPDPRHCAEDPTDPLQLSSAQQPRNPRFQGH
ncbi:hypothetical protein GCM10027570_01780 [Streptomonospora sediminis]